MAETLLSVGIDLGTSTTQLVFSQLQLQNNASAFAIADYAISERKILYESPVHFTPLQNSSTIDTPALRTLIEKEYAAAAIAPNQVQTGAVIITGETARKENAKQVLHSLADLAGDFVVATAGPDLEGILAARGAGADLYSKQTGQNVVHIDIGGGTSNFCLLQNGEVMDTGCLNVGGRLLKRNAQGNLTYVSPVLKDLCALQEGQLPSKKSLQEIAALLVQALEEALGLKNSTALAEKLTTNKRCRIPDEPFVLSLSGGVAALIKNPPPSDNDFGDIGPLLAEAITRSALWQLPHRLPDAPIRATVIGAGCHATSLSGSTIFYQNVSFPMQNLPVVTIPQDTNLLQPAQLAQAIQKQISIFQQDSASPVVLSLPGQHAPHFQELCQMADGVTAGLEPLRAAGYPMIIALQEDMAKALGQAIAFQLNDRDGLICLDQLHLHAGAYLDIGAPVAEGQVIPVVIKTLVLS